MTINKVGRFQVEEKKSKEKKSKEKKSKEKYISLVNRWSDLFFFLLVFQTRMMQGQKLLCPVQQKPGKRTSQPSSLRKRHSTGKGAPRRSSPRAGGKRRWSGARRLHARGNSQRSDFRGGGRCKTCNQNCNAAEYCYKHNPDRLLRLGAKMGARKRPEAPAVADDGEEPPWTYFPADDDNFFKWVHGKHAAAAADDDQWFKWAQQKRCRKI